MSNDNHGGIHSLVKNISEHIETRLEYAKLVTVEKLAIVLSRIISFGIIAALLFVLLLVFSVGCSLWIGDVLGSPYKGFMVVSGVYLLFILILLAFRKRFFEKKLIDIFITLSLAESGDETE